MKYDIFDLTLFITAAELGSITNASKSLNIVPAAGSVRIQKIERNLSVKLLIRQNKGVVLTPVGHIFLAQAKLVLSSISTLNKSIAHYSTGEKGLIKIKAVSIAAEENLPKYIGSYLLAYPEVNIEIESAFSDDIIASLRSGSCDIGIIGSSMILRDLEVFPFLSDSLVVICHSEHIISRRQSISFEEVLDHDYIGVNQAHSMYYLLLKYSKEIGKPFKMRATVSGWEQVCSIISQGIGLSVMELSAAQRLQDSHNFLIIPLSDSWAIRDFQICTSSLAELPYFAKDLVHRLTNLITI